jgi:hypothetical protein
VITRILPSGCWHFLTAGCPSPIRGAALKATAWKVGPAVLHTHFLTAGKLLERKKSYPSFRAYLVKAESLF